MGGFSGHIEHLHEDYTLSFGTLKNILGNLSSSKIPVTEKIDGINMLVSFSAIEGKLKLVRNKQHEEIGGSLIHQYSPQHYKKEIHEVLKSFEKYIVGLGAQVQTSVFGRDATIFYNCEVLHPAHTNVIEYGKKILVFQQIGHCLFNRATKKLDLQAENFCHTLIRRLVNTLGSDSQQTFAINPLFKLKFVQHNVFFRFVHNLQKGYSLKDEDTIADYIEKRLDPLIDLPPKLKSKFLQRISGKLKIHATKLKKQVSEELTHVQATLDEYLSHEKEMRSYALQPLVDILFGFSVELLDGVESHFTTNPEEAVEKIQQKVHQALTHLQADNQPTLMLAKMKQKLKHVGKLPPIEGIVFYVNSKPYKITGLFAPINQLFIGTKETLQENQVPTEKRKSVILIPGGFKPPHVGHYNMIKKYAEHPEVDKVVVLVSSKIRTHEETEITHKETMALFDMFNLPSNVEVVLAKTRSKNGKKKYSSPITDAYEYVQDNQNSQLNIALGGSDKGGDNKRIIEFTRNHAKGGKYHSERVVSPPVVVGQDEVFYPTQSKYEGPVSSQNMRAAIHNNDVEEFSYHLPPHLQKSARELLKKIQNNERVDEMSAMGAGAVSGMPSVSKKKQIKETVNDIIIWE